MFKISEQITEHLMRRGEKKLYHSDCLVPSGGELLM